MRTRRHPKSCSTFSRATQVTLRLAWAVGLAWALAAPLNAQTVVGTITRSGLAPSAVAVYEAGNKVFVADSGTGDLVMYDGATLEELGSVNVGEVWKMVVDESHGKLYATINTIGYFGGQLVEVNAATGAFIRQFDLDPNGILVYPFAHDPGLAKVYVLTGGFNVNLVQIDVATDTTASVPLGDSNFTLAALEVNPVTHEVFIGITGYGLPLQIVNGVTLEKTTGPADVFNGGFWGLGVNWIENKLYRADASGGPYSVYDRDTGSVYSIPANNDALVFGFNPTSNRMYTDSEVDQFATIMDGATDAFLNIGMYGTALGFRLSTNHAYYGGTTFNYLLDDATQLVEAIPNSDSAPTCSPPSGGSYSGLAVNQTTGRVFVMNTCFVTVIQDTKGLTRPPIFVGAPGSTDVYTIDPGTNSVTDHGWILSYPMVSSYGMAIRPGGGRLYTGRYDPYFYDATGLDVFAGLGTHTLLGSISSGGNNPNVPVVSPDATRIYVTNSASANVGAIDVTAGSVITSIPVGTTPWGLAITPSGAKVYVANRGDNTVSAISTASNTVTGTISVGISPWGVAVNPSGTKVYVANSGSNTVSVINTASDTVIATVPVGTTPHWLAAAPDGKRVYVSNNDEGTVSVIDTGTDGVVHTIPVGNKPEGVAVLPDGTAVYVANSNPGGSSTVSAINPADFAVSTITLPDPVQSWLHPQATPIAIADPTSKFAGRINNTGCPARVRALQGGVEKGSATTNAAGDYSIFNLLPGTYDLEASAAGFVTQTLTGQAVGAGRTTLANFTLSPGTRPVPALSSLSPTSAAAGGADFNLSVNGSNFFLESVVRWNGSDRPTQLAACGQLTASIPAGDIATPGTAEVKVFTPAPGGGLSTGAAFLVTTLFSNTNSIAFPDSGSPPIPSAPYPSNIVVSGLSGTISKLSVKLNGFSHTLPDDVDILLVAPNGANAIIMSDVGGSTAVTGVDLLLDDAAASPLPDDGSLVSGTFQPTNLGAGDSFPSPAPTPSGSSALSTFSGINPNGTWSLYIVNDTAGNPGSLAGGWSLTFGGPTAGKKRKSQVTSD